MMHEKYETVSRLLNQVYSRQITIQDALDQIIDLFRTNTDQPECCDHSGLYGNTGACLQCGLKGDFVRPIHKPEPGEMPLIVSEDPRMLQLAREIVNTPSMEEYEWRKTLLKYLDSRLDEPEGIIDSAKNAWRAGMLREKLNSFVPNSDSVASKPEQPHTSR